MKSTSFRRFYPIYGASSKNILPYVAEVIYTVQPDVSYDLDYDIVAGIDIGLSNLATVTSNKQGFQSLVINGIFRYIFSNCIILAVLEIRRS